MISGRNGNSVINQMKEFQECLENFPEDRFFNIIRMYLGEIKTPFNKQLLLEKLSGFFLNQENRQNILALLDGFDQKILTAVHLIQNVSQKRLEQFFCGEYPVSEICDKINNMVERLLILFKRKDNGIKIVINPLLRNLFEPICLSSVLIPQVTYASRNDDVPFYITPQFMAGVLAYVHQYPELCKNDGSIKKKDLERLNQIFLGKADAAQKVFSSFINLGILKQGDSGINCDSGKLAQFCKLKIFEQYIYLSAASAGFLSRESLRVQSQILADTIASIPEDGITRHSILQTAFLIGNKVSDGEREPFARRRFSMIIEQSRMAGGFSEKNNLENPLKNGSADESAAGAGSANGGSGAASLSGNGSETAGTGEQTRNHAFEIMDRILDFVIAIGILKCSGKTEKDEEIYVLGPALDSIELPPEGFRKVLNIDAGTNITILPGLDLADFVKLIPFMHITSCSTVTQLEICRKSVCAGFDYGYSIEKILEILKEYTAYEIPQSLKINIEEWNKAYTSAMLFKGYVLKIDEKNLSIAEDNPKITPFIQLKLAPGVYLLNIPIEEDCEEFLKNCGLDFIGSVKTAKNEQQGLGFPVIRAGKNYFAAEEERAAGGGIASGGFQEAENKKALPDEEKGVRLCMEFSEKLKAMEMSAQEKECLQYRIKRGIIVNSSQLNSGTVRIEILEAGGMDYAGKIHLINNAISTGSMIEFTAVSESDSGKIEKFFGLPQLLTKAEDSALVRITIEPEKEQRVFSVGRISHVKMIRRYI